MNKNLYQKLSRRLLFILIILVLPGYVLFGEKISGNGDYVSLQFRSEKVEIVLKEIKTQTGMLFIYNEKEISHVQPVTLNYAKVTLNNVLRDIAQQTGLSFQQIGQTIAVKFTRVQQSSVEKSLQVQTSVITGKVNDIQTGEPIVGVNIVIEGTSVGTISDVNGKFSIEVPSASSVLVFSFMGYISEKVDTRGKTEVNISLSPDLKALSEVVVVGYGTQKKVNLTGAVDQVGGDAFENRSVSNLSQGLQGLLPNLNITMKDGKPTQSPVYNVRGTTSIGQGGSALILIDGVEGDPSMINPNDIENISVLKDAASASVYGARGAFGVVLITTKKSSGGKTIVTYSVNHSIKQPTSIPDLVTNGYQWATMFNDAWSAWNDYSQTPQNANKTIKFSQDYLAELKKRSEDPSLSKVEVNSAGEYVYYGNTDWYKELYKKSFNSDEHNISIAGSTDKSSFYLSGRYFNQDGLFRYNTDDYRIYNLRAKGSTQLYKWLKVENNVEYSDMKYHNPINVGEGGGIWRNIADEGSPMAPLYNPDGTFSYTAAYGVGDFVYGKNGIDTQKKVFKNNTGFTSTFFGDKLKIKGDFTFQNTNIDQNQIRVQVPYSRVQGVIAYVGTSYNDMQIVNQTTQYLATNVFGEYETLFGTNHYFKAMLGYNYEQSTYKKVSITRNGVVFNDAQDLNLALGQSITTSGGWEKWNILGGVFRFNYIYKDRYLFEVNGRFDGSSKFPKSQRYAFFPSVSAGWRVSKEPFWRVSDKIISDLKIRASYGSLGNGNIASYAFQEQFSIAQSTRILNGVKPQYTSQPNVLPDGLTWETSTTKNIGIDIASVSNRLKLSGDAYIRNTSDMYTVGMTLPAVFGTTVPYGNYADLKTVGWEFSLGWKDKFTLASKPFDYDIRITMSDYQAEITSYNNTDKKLTDYYDGQKVGEIWGYVTEGLFTSAADITSHADQSLIKASNTGKFLPGDIKFKDLNDDGVINYGKNTLKDHGDMKVIGNSTPRYTYGINLGMNWNNFFFTSFFQGVGKQDWWPGIEADRFWGQYNRPYNDPLKSQIGKIWSESNPNAYFPRYKGYVAQSTSRELGVTQTRYLQNVAYIRMKNIQFGYNLPKNLIEKIRLNSAKIYISGENLWTWSPLYRITKSNIDVESIGSSDLDLTSGTSGNGNNYPILKSVTMGLSLTF